MTAHLDQVQTFCSAQRWYGEKGHDVHVEGLATSAWMSEEGAWPAVRIGFVYCAGPPGSPIPTRVYQLPLSYRREPVEHLGHALVGDWDEPDLGNERVWVYDALHDKDATPCWLAALTRGRQVDGLEFHPVGSPEGATPVPADAQSLVLTGEQSNTSLVFGDTALLKVFRRLEPGTNPGVEIEAALTEAGSEYVPEVLGYARGSWPAPDGSRTETGDLAMMTVFQKSATDGWTYALSSVRDLYAEGDLHAEEVGGDFAGESHRLGATTAAIHAELAKALETSTWDADQVAACADAMRLRLDRAVAAVPELQPYAAGLARAFDDLAAYGKPVPVQRIHGDFHLGQTLRTIDGWKIIDFEGEPAKSLVERQALDTTLKDIAGMLRSFDYAARSLLADHLGDQQIAYRAAEWANRNRRAFCDGYAEVAGADPRDEPVLLRAFSADKVIYEVVYEARNRPTWLPIPLAAAAALAQQ